MYGKHSSAILTDQNATMVATIPHVFPNTTHHLCLWHSDQNVVKHLGFIIKMTEDEADKSGNKFWVDFESYLRRQNKNLLHREMAWIVG
jgi:zinc finger SWIM domain-containing protein 3